MRKIKLFLAIAIVCLLFTSCADVSNVSECLESKPYGFWGGLWHGMVAPISFIGRLFSDEIAVYAINNNGRWYDLGFVLGAGILGFGSSKASK
jgi:hypothetical protein